MYVWLLAHVLVWIHSVCSVGLSIFYTHFWCHLCHDSETKMHNTDFKWLTAKTKVEGLHNDESVYGHTHQPRAHGNMPPWYTDMMQAHYWNYFLKENNEVPEKSFFHYLWLINCKVAEAFGHRRAENTTKRNRFLHWLLNRNIWVYDATRSMTETYITTKPHHQILMKWTYAPFTSPLL